MLWYKMSDLVTSLNESVFLSSSKLVFFLCVSSSKLVKTRLTTKIGSGCTERQE